MKRCSSKTHLIGLFVGSWLVALAFSPFCLAQNGGDDNDPHATGYVPPTPEQERYIAATHRRIVKVWPNRLAWLRVNEERKKKGLEPLPEKGIAPKRAEKDYTIGNGPIVSRAPKGFVGLTDLPGSVDNSLRDAFPDIRSQGSIGSCTNFAITYYQLTYTAGCDYGWHDNKNTSNNDTKFSPKWTYNMINRGGDNGSSPDGAYAVLERHGAARWSLFPYQGDRTNPKNYLEWCREGQTWQDAISYRIEPFDYTAPLTDDAGFGDWLTDIKTSLAGGEVLTFATYITGWQFTTIQDDKSTAEDNAFAHKPVASWVNDAALANHMMTIVGYNDSIWTDINKNRKVDPGEKGALRIANSWGTGWKDSGLCWLAYDALRNDSAVPDGPASGRQRAIAGKVFSIRMFSQDSKNPALPYQPILLAKFKLRHARRNQLGVALATPNDETWNTWIPGVLQFQGGPYAFDGTTTACEGTFVFDFNDVPDGTSDSYELWVADDDDLTNPDSVGSPDGCPAELLGYKLIDMTKPTTSGGLLTEPMVVDAGGDRRGLGYPSDPETTPVAVASAAPLSGRAPLTVTFDASRSSDTGGGPLSYLWDFGDGGTGVGVKAPHTYAAAGTYTATVTVADPAWSESSSRVVITVTASRKR